MIPTAPQWAIELAGWYVVFSIFLFALAVVTVLIPSILYAIDKVTP